MAAYPVDGVTDVLRAVDIVVAVDVLTPRFTVTARHDVTRAGVQGIVAVLRTARETLLAVHARNATVAIGKDARCPVPKAVSAIRAHVLLFLKALGRDRRDALGITGITGNGSRPASKSPVDEV